MRSAAPSTYSESFFVPGTVSALTKGMNNATLVGLMMLVVGGCAREATVAKAPASAPAEMSEECAGDCSPELDEETECMAAAELAYERAAGYAMTSLGDAPVPDAAYEDAYEDCIDPNRVAQVKCEREAERAWSEAHGGAVPPDSEYDSAYARCTEGR